MNKKKKEECWRQRENTSTKTRKVYPEKSKENIKTRQTSLGKIKSSI